MDFNDIMRHGFSKKMGSIIAEINFLIKVLNYIFRKSIKASFVTTARCEAGVTRQYNYNIVSCTSKKGLH